MTLRTALIIEGDAEGARKALGEVSRAVDELGKKTEEVGRKQVGFDWGDQAGKAADELKKVGDEGGAAAGALDAVDQAGSRAAEGVGKAREQAKAAGAEFGSLKTLAAAGAGFLAGFASAALAEGLKVAAGAAQALLREVTSSGPQVERALRGHEELVKRIKGAYAEAEGAASSYGLNSTALLRFESQQRLRDLQEALAAAQRDLVGVGAFNPTVAAQGGGRDNLGPFREAIEEVRRGLKDGKADLIAFRDEVAKIAEALPADSRFRSMAETIIGDTAEAAKVQAELARQRDLLKGLQGDAEAAATALGGSAEKYDQLGGAANAATSAVAGSAAAIGEAASSAAQAVQPLAEIDRLLRSIGAGTAAVQQAGSAARGALNPALPIRPAVPADGFASGGFTGPGGRDEPAGIVHRGEYVFDAGSTQRIGVANLEALRRGGLPGYRDGGAVGGGFLDPGHLGQVAAGLGAVNARLAEMGRSAKTGLGGVWDLVDLIVQAIATVGGQLSSLASGDWAGGATAKPAYAQAQPAPAASLATSAEAVTRAAGAIERSAGGLERFLAPGRPASHANFEDGFGARLERFLTDAGGGISIFSGTRSIERQGELFAAAVVKYGSAEAARRWVAPPGASQHNHGRAADLAYATDADRAWAHANAGAYGLNFRMAHEPWHIEPAANAAPIAAPVPVASPAAGPSGTAGTGNRALAALGAAASGFSGGYQSQNPFVGAFQGAIGGIGAGGWGIAAGLIGGLIGGIVGLVKAVQEARAELASLAPEINDFVAVGLGGGISAMGQSFRDYASQARQYQELAEKAYDFETYRNIAEAVAGYQQRLADDFSATFEATVDSLRDGFGTDGEWVSAQRAVQDLREEMKAFVADAEWTFGAGSGRAGQARGAAQAALLNQLGPAAEISETQAELQRLGGTASALRGALVELGMSGDRASRLIGERLTASIAAMREHVTADRNRALLELSGRGHINEMADAVAAFNMNVADMRALGLDASGAQDELALSLAAIADRAGLGAGELAAFGRAAGLTKAAIGAATEALAALAALAAEAERQRGLQDLADRVTRAHSALGGALDAAKRFIGGIVDYVTGIRLDAEKSILSPRDRFAAAQAEYRRLLAAAPKDEEARARLAGAAETYRESAAGMFSSSEGYVAVVREIEGGLGGLADEIRRDVALGERQLAASHRQVDFLDAANDNIVSLGAATGELKAAIDAYLGAEGTLTGPVTAAMTGTLTAAEKAVAAAAAAAAATEWTAQSAAQIAAALANPPARWGELPSRAGDDQKDAATRRRAEAAERARMEAIYPGLYSKYDGDIEKWRRGQQSVLEKITEWAFGPNSFLGGLLGFAEGGVFSGRRAIEGGVRVTAFAGGGVVDAPTMFAMSGGLGLMGEAGPEAILPLARGRDGRLGVSASVQGGVGPGAGNDNRTLAEIRDILADGLARIEGAVLAQGGGSEKAEREFARMREELLLARTTPPRATGTGGW